MMFCELGSPLSIFPFTRITSQSNMRPYSALVSESRALSAFSLLRGERSCSERATISFSVSPRPSSSASMPSMLAAVRRPRSEASVSSSLQESSSTCLNSMLDRCSRPATMRNRGLNSGSPNSSASKDSITSLNSATSSSPSTRSCENLV